MTNMPFYLIIFELNCAPVRINSKYSLRLLQIFGLGSKDIWTNTILKELEMSNVQLIYEQYQVLSQKAKDDFFEILRLERASKEAKLTKRLNAIQETEPFFKTIRKGLPEDYRFDREIANER